MPSQCKALQHFPRFPRKTTKAATARTESCSLDKVIPAPDLDIQINLNSSVSHHKKESKPLAIPPTPSQLTMFIKSLLLSLALLVPQALADCDLCGGAQITCADTVIRSDGQTCSGKQQEIFQLQAGSDLCTEFQETWAPACCVAQAVCPADTPLAPLDHRNIVLPAYEEILSVSQYGPEGCNGRCPRCPLCNGGSPPNNPSMVINMLYLGEGSCKQFDEWGKSGNIVGHRCDALQYFAREPCRCGQAGQAPPRPMPTPRINNWPGFSPTNPSPNNKPTGQKSNSGSNNKDGLKLSNARGGSGGRFVGGRQRRLGSGLKGRAAKE